MQLTGLESALLGLFFAMLGGIITRVFFLRTVVTRSACDARHQTEAVCAAQMGEEVSKLNKGQKVQFRMLRALIAYNKDMTPEEKAAVLNEQGGD